ncbi:protein TolR [Legionella parisiensis]|uniref:Tol-Pal system protein TolR n=1 Tax=Legionella parisiensis TaxID=45071 RepID=A0A1E5JNN5_9GAMM|nr:protein TolR [Legionella parisiensis]KTD41396.1 membrane spanning protein in TolA-TolQ-TolR complex [Legionella parisiensis]OEH46144.1 Biopolymer transport protein ExbD [Legionella parisiensis]STX76301.1 membrane spanning protein in TolA-TolQ-TolR complex [Legionella parisiensis]
MIRAKTKRERPISEINVVPYIDVMLVLLVIFMITAPMLSQGVTVDLPKAASQTLAPTDREPIIVSVNQQGTYFLNISSTPAEPIESQALVVRVAAELELAKQSNQKLNVLVKGDQGVVYGKVVQAMALLKQAGAEQVGLLTDSSQEKSEGQA